MKTKNDIVTRFEQIGALGKLKAADIAALPGGHDEYWKTFKLRRSFTVASTVASAFFLAIAAFLWICGETGSLVAVIAIAAMTPILSGWIAQHTSFASLRRIEARAREAEKLLKDISRASIPQSVASSWPGPTAKDEELSPLHALGYFLETAGAQVSHSVSSLERRTPSEENMARRKLLKSIASRIVEIGLRLEQALYRETKKYKARSPMAWSAGFVWPGKNEPNRFAMGDLEPAVVFMTPAPR